jgi:chemotaxis protein methyltransferase CheR
MTEKEFFAFSKLIYSECGIKMPPTKKTMLKTRLMKRLRSLGMDSFSCYYEYVSSPNGRSEELWSLIDVVSTNKTDFFREPSHFDYLVQNALPALLETHGPGNLKRIRIWSAGCSSGEEPYTLAIVMSEYSQKIRGLKFSILSTDISTKVLDKAVVGIYEHEKVLPIPMALKKKYLMRSKDKNKDFVRFTPEIRSLIKFRRLNLMENDFQIREPMQIIFCRNVIIYFDRPTQEAVLSRICRHLIPGGYLFVGHSETLSGLNLPLVPLSNTVYRKSV